MLVSFLCMDISVIKLGAAGDVVRTLPILKAIKDVHPNGTLTLVTKGDISLVFQSIPFIENVLTLPLASTPRADILYNFDVDQEALRLAEAIPAKKKYGFCNSNGYPGAYNPGAEYYLNTIFDDELKKNNNKTYQEMMFEAAELQSNKEPYLLNISSQEKEKADGYIQEKGIDPSRLIGIHMGASSRWPSKVWAQGNLKLFIKKAVAEGYSIMLFGGPNEAEEHQKLSQELTSEGVPFHHNNPHNSKLEFLALLNECRLVICSDSFALHMALGLHKPTIALFFCTSPHEVEGYGFLTKLIAPKLYDFFPEKSDVFDAELVSSISPADVWEAAKRLFTKV